MSFTYPVVLNVKNKKCVVIGGGRIGRRKAVALLLAGAEVWLVAPEVNGDLDKLIREGKIRWIQDVYHSRYLEDSFLVVAAASDREVNEEVARFCHERHLLLDVVDNGDLGSFSSAACLRRGDLLIAVSTNGQSPALAKKIIDELEQLYGPGYARATEVLGEARTLARSRFARQEEREKKLHDLLESGIVEMILEGRTEEARERMKEWLS